MALHTVLLDVTLFKPIMSLFLSSVLIVEALFSADLSVFKPESTCHRF